MSGIVSVFKTPRPCLKCGAMFLPPKRPNRVVDDHCSLACGRPKTLAERLGYTPREEAEERAVHVVSTAKAAAPRARDEVVRSRFARRLIGLRKARGMSQATMAARIGVHPNTANLWERDRRDPYAHHLAALADLFGVTMDALWHGEQQREERSA